MTDANLQLDTLEAKGLIRLAAFQPELEYLFRHALVQDTAYESLLKQERRSLHRLVGDALEELYPERHGDLAAVLAMHFEEAGDTVRAITYLMIAAKYALDRNAITESYDLYTRANALLPPTPETENEEQLRLRVEIGLGRARTGFAFAERGKQIEILDDMIANAERLGDLRLIADAHVNSALQRQFDGERPETSESVRHSLERVAVIAKQLNDPAIAALPKSLIGLSQVFTGYLREGIENLAEAAPLLGEKRDFVGSSFALMSLGVGYARLGEFDKAEAAIDRALEVAKGGDLIARLDSLIGQSMVKSQKGDLEAAIPLALQCTSMAEDAGATACVVGSNLVLGESYMRQGNFGSAKIAFDRGHEVAEVTNQRIFRPSIAAYRRSLAVYMGDPLLNGRTFEEALDESRQLGDRWGETNVIWRRAEAVAAKPDPDRAQMTADYTAATAAFEGMGARPSLARVYRDWGHALRKLGDEAGSREKLERSLAIFKEVGIEREANEVSADLVAAA